MIIEFKKIEMRCPNYIIGFKQSDIIITLFGEVNIKNNRGMLETYFVFEIVYDAINERLIW